MTKSYKCLLHAPATSPQPSSPSKIPRSTWPWLKIAPFPPLTLCGLWRNRILAGIGNCNPPTDQIVESSGLRPRILSLKLYFAEIQQRRCSRQVEKSQNMNSPLQAVHGVYKAWSSGYLLQQTDLIHLHSSTMSFTRTLKFHTSVLYSRCSLAFSQP
jgi:hypothetical protein